ALVRVEQPDHVLDADRLTGSGRTEDHRDHALGEAHVQAAEDPGSAERLVGVDELDRVRASGGVHLVGVELVLILGRSVGRRRAGRLLIDHRYAGGGFLFPLAFARLAVLALLPLGLRFGLRLRRGLATALDVGAGGGSGRADRGGLGSVALGDDGLRRVLGPAAVVLLRRALWFERRRLVVVLVERLLVGRE